MTIFISMYFFITIVIIVFMFSYVILRTNLLYSRFLLVLGLFISIYIFGYAMELNSSTIESMLLWNKIQYIGLSFYAAFWLIVSLLFTKTIKRISFPLMLALFIIPVLTFVFRLTNSMHNFYYTSFTLVERNNQVFLQLGKGFWYYIQLGYSVLTLIITNILYGYRYKKSKKANKKIYRVLIFASLIPILGISLILTDFWNTGLDYAALIVPVSIILFSIAIFKYDMFELKATARDSIFTNNENSILIIDNDYNIIDYNKNAEEFFSSLDIEIKILPLNDLLINNKQLLDKLYRDNNEDFALNNKTFEIQTTKIKNKDNNVLGFFKTIIDISDKKRAEQKLNYLATTDELSGLKNRHSFMEEANATFYEAKLTKTSFCLAMIDIDFFKTINDKFGHPAGDSVIKHIGSLLKKKQRAQDIIGRVGGEEFCMVIRNADKKEAFQIIENLRKEVEAQTIEYESSLIKITISCGLTCFDKNINDFSQMLRLADKAMYQSKDKGKNCSTKLLYKDIQK